MPIHPVGMLHRKGTLGSPYSVRDYYAVNPDYGTLDDFKRLVDHAHAMGFHLIIDLVANHTSWDSKLIGEHPEWFTKDSAGQIVSPNPDWTDVADLDYSRIGLRRYMIEMMKYWVRDVGVDGFRCDVAEMVPLDFWDEARAAVDSIKPVMMLAEGALPSEHLHAFDLTYSWNVYHDLDPLIHQKKFPQSLDNELKQERSAFPNESLFMRFSSNHDENAWDAPDVIKFGERGAMLAAVLVNTLPGVPLLYNGQEVGNAKKLRLFEKDTIDWAQGDEFLKLYSLLFALRKDHSALIDGGMILNPTTNDSCVYAFTRVSGNDRVVVALNFSERRFIGSIKLSSGEIRSADQTVLEDVMTKRTETVSSSGRLPITIPPMGYRIFFTAQPR